ncbi:hypothetical protein [Oceanicoccus sagamiensis]|uniref:Pyrroloquinoline quinone biosynthesis protein PqqE n=1 Tax=Oceanicoccus sagamiensis TaxID=716816 RepID=A0A1X9NE91_9GAMM|nr:hypothetical protein [Oceanicoccus sagamiensis]ARN76350.1 hypothetical protein BST96_08910 [Oceanicoccus sagamiensis]
MINSVLSTGLQGVQSGVSTAQRAAEDIVQATTTDPQTASGGDSLADITEAAVSLKVGEQQVQASAAVVKTADEVLGTLLDTKA